MNQAECGRIQGVEECLEPDSSDLNEHGGVVWRLVTKVISMGREEWFYIVVGASKERVELKSIKKKF